jgi:hypothetical protein
MDKVQKTPFTDYNAPSSERFRLHLLDIVLEFVQRHTGKAIEERSIYSRCRKEDVPNVDVF